MYLFASVVEVQIYKLYSFLTKRGRSVEKLCVLTTTSYLYMKIIIILLIYTAQKLYR